jgi:hypothetical protein
MTPEARPGGVRRRIEAICLGLPEAREITEGRPALEHARDAALFQVVNRTFAWYLDNHHNDGRCAAWCRAGEQRDQLVRANPAVYFVPPYLGRRGWVGVRLDVDVDWLEVTDLVEESYRSVAPARLLRHLG